MDKKYTSVRRESMDLWQWCMVQPAVAQFPATVNEHLLARVYQSIHSIPFGMVFRRILLYVQAGCPRHLCEYAAARDCWACLNGVYDL
jgi:hypothetical protein